MQRGKKRRKLRKGEDRNRRWREGRIKGNYVEGRVKR